MSRHQLPVSQRQLRIGEEVRHALARIFERGEIRDPELADTAITVTEVRMSSDLRQATAFVVPLGGGREAAIVAALGRARGFLRRRIAEDVHFKFVPEVRFLLDRSFEQADKIAQALRDPLVARDLKYDKSAPEDADEHEGGKGTGKSG